MNEREIHETFESFPEDRLNTLLQHLTVETKTPLVLRSTVAAYVIAKALEYFTEHEPTVADAIRYGLVARSPYADEEPIYIINYPEGHNV